MNRDIKAYKFIKQLSDLECIDSIILYGSRARKDNKEKSDIDLAIVLNCEKTSEISSKIYYIIDDADTLLKIDLVYFNNLKDESDFKKNIIKDGVILFKRKFTMIEKLNRSFVMTEDALFSLENVLNEPMDKDEYMKDASIQRFEYSIELFWKLLKIILENKCAIIAKNPKDILSESYAQDFIENEQIWLDMIKDRNRTSHLYDQALANEIYQNIKEKYFNIMDSTFVNLKEKFFQIEKQDL